LRYWIEFAYVLSKKGDFLLLKKEFKAALDEVEFKGDGD
jgi:hypothetical protein